MGRPSLLQSQTKRLCERWGGCRGAGRALDIDPGYLSRLMSGAAIHPSDEILDKLGLEKKIIYRKKLCNVADS